MRDRRPCLPSLLSCAQSSRRADVLAAWSSVGVDWTDGDARSVTAGILATDGGARAFFEGVVGERDRRTARGEVRASDAREARAFAVTRAFVACREVLA